MAEFCLECWNKLNGTEATETDYVLSGDLDLCEGCGEYKRVVVCKRCFPALYTLIRSARRKREKK